MPSVVFALLILCGLCALLEAGCHREREKRLDAARFAEVYADLVVASLDTTVTDSLQRLQNVLRKHRLDEEIYNNSLSYFRRHPRLWLEVFEKVADNLEDISKKQKPQERTKTAD